MELVLALAHGITKRHHVAFFTIFWGSKSNFGRVHSQHKGSKCVHRNRDLLPKHVNFMGENNNKTVVCDCQMLGAWQ